MKKLLAILVLGLLWCNVGFGEEQNFLKKLPKWDHTDLNMNVIEYGWKIKSSKMITYPSETIKGRLPLEIYTLRKGNWILKCLIRYMNEYDDVMTTCDLP